MPKGMYIRIKSRKNSSGKLSDYAYLVLSKRKYKKPRQKVIAYLGKVYQFPDTELVSLEPNYDLLNAQYKSLIMHLISLQLIKMGFKTSKENVFIKDKILVDLNSKRVYSIREQNPISLKINNGFISDYTLSKLINYNPPKTHLKGIGKDFANFLTLTGLQVQETVFLELFNKIRSMINEKQ